MYKLSKTQIGMFVRALMPELYRMQEVKEIFEEIDRGKPPEQLHQMGHRADSPRIARLKAKAAMAEAANKSSAKAKLKESGGVDLCG